MIPKKMVFRILARLIPRALRWQLKNFKILAMDVVNEGSIRIF